jgi:hypothetical protein
MSMPNIAGTGARSKRREATTAQKRRNNVGTAGNHQACGRGVTRNSVATVSPRNGTAEKMM